MGAHNICAGGDALQGSSPTPHACCGRWLLVNFDCSCLWVRDAEPLKEALSLTPHFLRAKGNALDYKACGAVHSLLASLERSLPGKGLQLPGIS